jgi:hypothetical protein
MDNMRRRWTWVAVRAIAAIGLAYAMESGSSPAARSNEPQAMPKAELISVAETVVRPTGEIALSLLLNRPLRAREFCSDAIRPSVLLLSARNSISARVA